MCMCGSRVFTLMLVPLEGRGVKSPGSGVEWWLLRIKLVSSEGAAGALNH